MRTVWPSVDGVIPRNEKLAHVVDHGPWTDVDALTRIGNTKGNLQCRLYFAIVTRTRVSLNKSCSTRYL